jgi:hypothetical protein
MDREKFPHRRSAAWSLFYLLLARHGLAAPKLTKANVAVASFRTIRAEELQRKCSW